MRGSSGLVLTVYPDFDNAPYSGLSCHKNLRKKIKRMGHLTASYKSLPSRASKLS